MLKERYCNRRKWLIRTNRKLKKCYGVSYIELAELTHNIAKQVNSCFHKIDDDIKEILGNFKGYSEYNLAKVALKDVKICINCLNNVNTLIGNTIPSKENEDETDN